MNDYLNTGHLPPATVAVPSILAVSLGVISHATPSEKTKVPGSAPTPAPAQIDPIKARQALEEATRQLNEQLQRNSRDLSFSVDEVTNTVVVTVKNRHGEVVRQIPNEVALRIAHNFENMKGLLQDEKS